MASFDFENLDLDYESIVSDLLGYPPETTGDINIRFECPFCHSYHKKFYLNTNNGLYTCFNCEESGNIITLVRATLECSFKDALDYLEDWGAEASDLATIAKDPELSVYDSVLQVMTKPIANEKKLVPPMLPTHFRFLIDDIHLPQAQPYLQYLARRGVSLQQVKDYNIGYVIDGMTRGAKALHIANSIVFPTYSDDHKIIYWNTRSLTAKKYYKTINAPNSEDELSKGEVVYNLNEIKQGSNIVIAESVFNALTVTLPPRVIGVATFGKQATDKQLELIKSKLSLIKNIFLFLDTDAKKVQYILAQRLQKIGIPSSKIYMVNNPYTDKDINDLGTKKSLELISKATPFNSPMTKLNFLI